MKIRLLFVGFASCLWSAIPVFSQGGLFPAGAPGPAMKTLQQVEPRTDIATLAGTANAMHRITQSGSYYLSGNLDVTNTYGIDIRVSGVTLDLNGFMIYRSSQAAASGTAIYFGKEVTNVRIFNGNILGDVAYDSQLEGDQFTGPGFLTGIGYGAEQPFNVVVKDLMVSGCDQNGIDLGFDPSTSVVDSHVRIAGNVGIRAGEILRSMAFVCGGDALYANGSVVSSRGSSVGEFGVGINAGGAVIDSRGDSVGLDGIQSLGNVMGSTGNSTGPFGDGIYSSAGVIHSTGTSSDNYGIRAAEMVKGSIGRTDNSVDSRAGIDANLVSHSVGRATAGNNNGINGGAVHYSRGFRSSVFSYNTSASAHIGNYPDTDNYVGGYKYLMP